MKPGHASGRANLQALTLVCLPGLFVVCQIVHPPTLHAGPGDDVVQALTGGDPGLALRYRFEYVDEEGFEDDALASTLRARLNYRTGQWRAVQGFLEFDAVRELVFDDFNGGAGTTPGRTLFPVVADPADTRVNQAYLDFAPAGVDLRLRAGRQRIQLDNDRFIGNVGWRQNEQTYDAAGLSWRPAPRVELFYAYVARVNRIFGSDVPDGRHDHDTHLFNLSGEPAPGHRLAGYFYEVDNEDAAAQSNRTLGMRYTGRTELDGQRRVEYTAELARQTDAGDNPVGYTAFYRHLNAAFVLNPLAAFHADVEILTGDRRPGRALRTPLATAHAFNGWADRFVTTPDAGLEDRYVGYSGRAGRLAWQLRWHHFRAEAGNVKYGSELDGSLSVSLHERVSLLLKGARFNSSDPAFPDVTKLWTMLSAEF